MNQSCYNYELMPIVGLNETLDEVVVVVKLGLAWQ